MPYITKQKFQALLVLCCLSFSGMLAQDTLKKPKLVVGIVVDQMRYDYLSRFSEKYSDNGFKKLLAEGFSFQNNNLNYVPTNTAPGHASIYTGTTPSVHGILGNSWYSKAEKRAISCVYDSNVEPVGTGLSSEKKSPQNLLVKTIGDLNRKATNMQGKTISIALKDRAAILSGGLEPNAAYWFSGKDLGQWISSSYYIDELPKWVREVNESDVLAEYLTEWNTLYNINSYTESDADNSRHERGFRSKDAPTFPYDLQELKSENRGYDILKSTPFGNSYTLDFATKALEGETLGKDEFTDVLLISLSSTDYIGHNFGVDSKEIEDAYIRLDNDLAKFIEVLNDDIGKDNYTLFLTADHGASENSNHLTERGGKGGFFKEGTFKNDLKGHMFSLYKEANIIENVSDNQVFLDRDVIHQLDLKISEVTVSVKDFISEYPEVASVLSRSELLKNTFTEGLPMMMQNGFHPERSGDIMYLLSPNTVIYSEQGSSHGSAYKYDTHVPLIFYGSNINSGRTETLTTSTQIAPTLAKMLRIKTPKHMNSKPLLNK